MKTLFGINFALDECAPFKIYQPRSLMAFFLCFATYKCQFLLFYLLAYVSGFFENQRIARNVKKYFKKTFNIILSVCRKCLPLHPQLRGTPLEMVKKEFFENIFHTDK